MEIYSVKVVEKNPVSKSQTKPFYIGTKEAPSAQLSVVFILVWCGAFKMKKKKNQFRFFSGKMVTSLADIFTMEKALFEIIFGHIIFLLVNRFSKVLLHFLQLQECKMVTWSYFS